MRNALSQAPGAGPALCILTRAPGTLLTLFSTMGLKDSGPSLPEDGRGDCWTLAGRGDWVGCPILCLPTVSMALVSMLSRVRTLGIPSEVSQAEKDKYY